MVLRAQSTALSLAALTTPLVNSAWEERPLPAWRYSRLHLPFPQSSYAQHTVDSLLGTRLAAGCVLRTLHCGCLLTVEEIWAQV